MVLLDEDREFGFSLSQTSVLNKIFNFHLGMHSSSYSFYKYSILCQLSCSSPSWSSVIIFMENKSLLIQFNNYTSIVWNVPNTIQNMHFTGKLDCTKICSKSSAILWKGKPGMLMEFVFINMKCLGMFDFSVGLLSQA